MEQVESELKDFLEHCKKQRFNEAEMSSICQPLVWHLRLLSLRRWTLWFLLPALLSYLLWSYCDTCAWTVSAVGRLLLIQVLPFWNWTPYYNAKCLIERAESTDGQRPSRTLSSSETLWENCALCESLEFIPTISNVSYSLLETDYLERGLPLIVTDCQLEQKLDNLLQRILHKTPELLDSEPCDISSSLLLRHLFNLDAAIQKIRLLQTSPTAAWHLQFRNCVSSAVKKSRLYAEKPYFYPKHLEPYYSSWLLMAHNMRRPQTNIYVRGLIFVQQLSAHFEFRLQPKQPCNDGICPNLNLRLTAGECLVFSTDLWRISYGINKPEKSVTSIATLFEVNWEL